MVSRGGRSKGCSHCRRRRVKCDETRPICNRCKKRGLECDGPKDATWISQNNTFPPSPPDGDPLALVDSLPSTVSFVAFEDDICLAYTRKHLLRGGNVELACDMIEWRHVPTDAIANLGLDLLRKAVLSLSVTFFGSQHRQKKIRNRGYQQYGAVLRQLNSHLAQTHHQTTDETILTVLTCMMLEVFLPTGPNHFLMHVRGLEAILEIRGPPIGATGTTAAMFHGLRVLSIIGGLAQSRPSVWARQEWKNFGPIYPGEGAKIRHEIFQILADCTLLMTEKEELFAKGLRAEGYQPLLVSAKKALSDLKAIYPRWESYNVNQMDETTSEMGKDFRIANHASATTYMLYNATYMCILRIIHSLDPSPKYASLRNAAAIKIVRCLELKQFEKRSGNAESNTIGFVATKVAWETLGGFSSPEGRRLARTVKAAADGVFAVGAWDSGERHRPKLPPFPGPNLAENDLRIPWNQPLWTPIQAADSTGEVPAMSPREIINIGQRPTKEQILAERYPPGISFQTPIHKTNEKEEHYLSIQHRLQSSVIIEQLQNAVGSF